MSKFIFFYVGYSETTFSDFINGRFRISHKCFAGGFFTDAWTTNEFQMIIFPISSQKFGQILISSFYH